MGDKNVIKQRRAKWNTYLNLNLWFETREEIVIDLGFAQKESINENGDGTGFFTSDGLHP